MTATQKKFRPNCGQILDSRDDWSISHENFNDEFYPNSLIIEVLKLESKEKSFCYKFIEHKFKNFNWGKYNKIKEYMLCAFDIFKKAYFYCRISQGFKIRLWV
jgi:hypothetical protein